MGSNCGCIQFADDCHERLHLEGGTCVFLVHWRAFFKTVTGGLAAGGIPPLTRLNRVSVIMHDPERLLPDTKPGAGSSSARLQAAVMFAAGDSARAADAAGHCKPRDCCVDAKQGRLAPRCSNCVSSIERKFIVFRLLARLAALLHDGLKRQPAAPTSSAQTELLEV